MTSGYPLMFRPNQRVDIYDAANTRLAGPFEAQVFKPLLATSLNTYTLGGVTVWAPGATIVRAVVKLGFTVYDVPGGAARYFRFLNDPTPATPKKWRVVSAYTWAVDLGGVNYTAVFLGEIL